jgi:hypothetical protein
LEGRQDVGNLPRLLPAPIPALHMQDQTPPSLFDHGGSAATWLIDFADLKLARVIGEGAFGKVFLGRLQVGVGVGVGGLARHVVMVEAGRGGLGHEGLFIFCLLAVGWGRQGGTPGGSGAAGQPFSCPSGVCMPLPHPTPPHPTPPHPTPPHPTPPHPQETDVAVKMLTSFGALGLPDAGSESGGEVHPSTHHVFHHLAPSPPPADTHTPTLPTKPTPCHSLLQTTHPRHHHPSHARAHAHTHTRTPPPPFARSRPRRHAWSGA